MNSRLKLALYAVPGIVGSFLLALVAKADTIDDAIASSVSSGTARVGTILTNNLPMLFGIGVAIAMIFLAWRLFKRFVGGR